MDPNYPLPPFLQGNPITTVTRYLPEYEEANLPYSYRLPTYRSSYIRRYHPYPRYTVSLADEHLDDDVDGRDEAPLDLDIYVAPAALGPAAPAPDDEHNEDHPNIHEGPAEERREKLHLVVVDPDRPSVFVNGSDDGIQADQVDLHDSTMSDQRPCCKADMA